MASRLRDGPKRKREKEMTRALVAIVAGVVSVAVQPGATESAPADGVESVREVPVDTLRDLAIAVYDARHPVIYFNPSRMQNLGPNLAAFFMAHEYGHIHFRHTRANAMGVASASRDSVLQSRELAADCYATAALARTDREAIDAAVRYFSRQGPFRFDVGHPTGAQRAANILACLPATPAAVGHVPSRASKAAARTGDAPILFAVQTSSLVRGHLGLTTRFRIGARVYGVVSNIRQPSTLSFHTLPAGTYDYQIDIEVYALDEMQQFNPGGSVSGQGRVEIAEGRTLEVTWSPGGVPALVEVSADALR